MRFVADENVEAAVVAKLKSLGHDVLEVGQFDRGIDDEEVLRLARREGRVLVTNDKDFGQLVFRQGRRVPGVLLLRLPGRTGASKASLVMAALQEAGIEPMGHFVVVEDDRVRSRRLK